MTARDGAAGQTFTAIRALMLEEPLIFEIGSTETTGVDFPDGDVAGSRLGDLTRTQPIGLPASPSRKRSVIIRGSAGRITRSTWGCSRSARAR